MEGINSLKVKVKQFLYRPSTGTEVSSMLRVPDFKKIGTLMG